jgi:hypothetical protein
MSEIQWSKITIGGTMALCEGLAAGHAMEQAKIGSFLTTQSSSKEQHIT